MKPLGLTAGFKVITPTKTQDAIWDAVEWALIENMSAADFKEEVAQAWEELMKRQAKWDIEELRT